MKRQGDDYCGRSGKMDSKTQIYNFVTGDTAFDSVIYWNGEDKN